MDQGDRRRAYSEAVSGRASFRANNGLVDADPSLLRAHRCVVLGGARQCADQCGVPLRRGGGVRAVAAQGRARLAGAGADRCRVCGRPWLVRLPHPGDARGDARRRDPDRGLHLWLFAVGAAPVRPSCGGGGDSDRCRLCGRSTGARRCHSAAIPQWLGRLPAGAPRYDRGCTDNTRPGGAARPQPRGDDFHHIARAAQHRPGRCAGNSRSAPISSGICSTPSCSMCCYARPSKKRAEKPCALVAIG